MPRASLGWLGLVAFALPLACGGAGRERPSTGDVDAGSRENVDSGTGGTGFDPRTDGIRFGRVLIARGRAAADVPLTHSFGKQELKGFDVWIDKLGDALDAPTPPSPFS